MFAPYREILRLPGALRFSAAGLVGRMQMSMVGLGAILLLSVERDSYAVAGTAAAMYAIASALISPQISRLIDSRGQRRIVPLQLAVHLPAIAALIVLAVATTQNWPLYVAALVAGAAQPNIGPLVRARWSVMLTGTGALRTAFAWESLVDEFVFIVGPPLATILAIQLFPSSTLIVATALMTLGLYFFLGQTETEPTPSGEPVQVRGRSAIALPGVAAIFVIYILLGGIFGAWEVTTIAFSAEQGNKGAAGVLLAVYSAGSLVGGLFFGVLRLRASLVRQFLAVLTILAVVTFPLPMLDSLWLLGIGCLIAGIAVAPVLISGMSLIERIVPAARLTESMSWASSGLMVGLALASPIAGVVVDGHSASSAYWIQVSCAAGAAAIGWLMLGPLRRANNSATARIDTASAGGVSSGAGSVPDSPVRAGAGAVLEPAASDPGLLLGGLPAVGGPAGAVSVGLSSEPVG